MLNYVEQYACDMLDVEVLPARLKAKLNILDSLCIKVGGRLISRQVVAQEVFNHNMNNSCSFTG